MLRLRFLVVPACTFALALPVAGTFSVVSTEAAPMAPQPLTVTSQGALHALSAEDLLAENRSLKTLPFKAAKAIQTSATLPEDLPKTLNAMEPGMQLAVVTTPSEPMAPMVLPTPNKPEDALDQAELAGLMDKKMEITIGQGDTLTEVLEKAGIKKEDAYNAVQAMSKHYDPRRIKPGQKIEVELNPEDISPEGGIQLASLSMAVDPVKSVYIKRDDSGYKADQQEKKLHTKVFAKQATIKNSLYGTSVAAGIPISIVAKTIRMYSWNVDFQRDIRAGDKINVLYDARVTDDGHIVENGKVLYASLTIGGKEMPLYRYEMKDGTVDYFDENGRSAKKTLMKTPIDGARLSSGFGMRRHPVLGYNKMHKGTDFAASTGTPIYAAGDGKIEKQGHWGAYGKYVRIRHNSSLKTAYAHMSRFAKGLSAGSRVRQGQIIGYVGTTGRSTGPHLHYEVLVNDKQVNPRSVDLPTGEDLIGEDMRRFKEVRAEFDQEYASLSKDMRFAQRTDSAVQ